MHLLWSAAIPVPADASLHWFSHASGYLLPMMRALDALDVLPGKLRAIAAHVEAELRASLEAPPLPRRDKFLAYVRPPRGGPRFAILSSETNAGQ